MSVTPYTPTSRLVFDKAPATNGRLVFGDDGNGAGPLDVALSASVQLPGMRVVGALRTAVAMVAVVQLPGLKASGSLQYSSNVDRPLVSMTGSTYQQADQLSAGMTGAWRKARQLNAAAHDTAQPAAPVASDTASRWQEAGRIAARVLQGFQQANELRSAVISQYQETLKLRQAATGRYEEARPVLSGAASPFQETVYLRVTLASRFETARALSAGVAQTGGLAWLLSVPLGGRYQEAMYPPPGVRAPVVPPIEHCYTPSGRLVFSEGWTGTSRLIFICDNHETGPEPGGTVVVPVKRTYIVLNSISLHRVDTGVELLASSFSMQLDYRSWTWSWSASLHESAARHLGRGSDGYPVELEAVVNSVPVRLRLTQKAVQQPFLPRRIAVGGKGKSAVLSADYAPMQTFSSANDRTAQQLMNEVLSINGVPLGWAVDWQIPDWYVPGNSWSKHGAYIDAVQDIATAAGAYVQPHNTEATLRILPEYPVAPWEWAGVNPDYDLPEGIASLVDVDDVDKPAYNAVWLSGMKSGVFGPFGRTGSAKDVYAPQVLHSLMTDATVHRSRGLAEIARSGPKQMVTLNAMVLPETKLILPGKFVRFQGQIGLVRGIGVTWQSPRLRQRLLLETYQNA